MGKIDFLSFASEITDGRRAQQFDQLYAEVSEDTRWLLDEYVAVFIKNIKRFGPTSAKSLIISCLRWKFEHERERGTQISQELTKVWRTK